jgi:hypothetical protein
MIHATGIAQFPRGESQKERDFRTGYVPLNETSSACYVGHYVSQTWIDVSQVIRLSDVDLGLPLSYPDSTTFGT